MRHILLVALTLSIGGSCLAATGVMTRYAVYQLPPDGKSPVLLQSDSALLLERTRAVGYLAGFSMELEAAMVDSTRVQLTALVVTLGPHANTYSRQFTADTGLPCRVDSIAGKAGCWYRLVLTPGARTEVDTTECRWRQYRAEDFKTDPTAHTDIYYVENTHGDYYWNTVKTLLEDRYDEFNELIKFNLPGKYNVYLCPCELPSVLWDRRFGVMIDPTRSTIYAIYHKGFLGASPFLPIYAALARHYGYAPPLLAEGFANYLSASVIDMRRLKKDGRTVPLAALCETQKYFSTDPEIVDATAGSFVRYLIETYKITKFLDCYRQAHDLNLKSAIEKSFGASLAQLESGWKTYVDTVSFTAKRLGMWADEAESMLQYRRMEEISALALEAAPNRHDSGYRTGELVRAAFFSGNYYRAADIQSRQVATDTTGAQWMSLAGYLMMNGEYDSAKVCLDRAQKIDTAQPFIVFNRAFWHTVAGNKDSAIALYRTLLTHPQAGGVAGQVRVLLGELLRARSGTEQKKEADRLFQEAITLFSQSAGPHNVGYSNVVWAGLAFVGTGDSEKAEETLALADFLETRPFYKALISLGRGKAADLRGERQVARDYYGQVLALGGAAYHQAEARQFLDKPYRH